MTDAALPQTTKDNPLLGILFMLAFCLVIPFADALMKLLGQMVPVLTVLLIRYVMQVLLMTPIMLWQQGGLAHIGNLSPRIWWRLVWRTVMHIAGIVGMYFGLRHMPLADTTAIAFIFPILMLLVGHLFLKEQVGPHRIAAALVGFIGTLLVVQPNFVAVGLNALWPIGVACTFVVFTLVTRQMSHDIDPVSIQVLSGFMALIVLVPTVLLVPAEAGDLLYFLWPQGQQWGYLLAIGVIGSFGHLFMTTALRYAPSATLAPMQYIEIPFATFIGWLIFSDLPNQLAAFGIVITVSAGLYIIYREQRAQKASG